MGRFVNPDNSAFQAALNSRIYVDKSAVIEMLSGDEVKVNTATFKNDTVNIQNRDEVLTYMIHLGYLGYDQNRRSAFVPNEEIRQELTLAVREIVV